MNTNNTILVTSAPAVTPYHYIVDTAYLKTLTEEDLLAVRTNLCKLVNSAAGDQQ